MKSSKKIVIIIFILLVILLLAGGAFAYVYVATDIFRTDKEMFFTYFAQAIAEENGFFDKRIENFYEKKTQTGYESSGEITTEVVLPQEVKDEMMLKEEILEKVNGLAVRFSGKVDSVNQKVEQNIEMDYGNNVILPINYKQDGNSIGLQSNELAKKYIAVRNENLKQLVTNLGIEDVSDVPDKFELPENVENVNITEADIEQLKQIYMPVLQENLLQENFSSVKTEKNESYTLDLTSEQIKNIIIKMLEKTKSNTLIIDKINEILLEQDPETEKLNTTDIDDIIESINKEDISDIPSIKITLIQSDKLLNQIILQLEENIITIEKRNTTDSLSYNINLDLRETTINEKIESNSLFEQESKSEPQQFNIYFNVQYMGLDSLTKVNEKCEFGIDVISDQEIMKYDYLIDVDTQFNNNLDIEPLDNSVAIFLNDYDETQLTPFLTQVGTRLLEINKNQMAELGLKEYENPLLYSSPVIGGLLMYNLAAEQITEADLTRLDIETFNAKFTTYEGENIKGSEVNALIETVQNNSLSSAGSEAHLVKVTLDGVETVQRVSVSNSYNIEAIYDEEGYVIEMKVTTDN